MKDDAFREQQFRDRFVEHIAPINHYVDELNAVGRGWVPYVAPLHGGRDAQVLSILRDPGPGTLADRGSSFLCTENDDGSAELQTMLMERTGLSPRVLLPWNAYPWYINRAPRASEIRAGTDPILRILDIARDVRVVLLQGRDAEKAWKVLRRREPEIEADRGLSVVRTFHPSRRALQTPDPTVRAARVAHRENAFQMVADLLSVQQSSPA